MEMPKIRIDTAFYWAIIIALGLGLYFNRENSKILGREVESLKARFVTMEGMTVDPEKQIVLKTK